MGAQTENIVRNSDRSLDHFLDVGLSEPGRGAQAQFKLELGHGLAEIVGLPRVEERQGARFVVVEALELAVVQAVSELLVKEEREVSRASRESIREDGSIVLLRRLEENLLYLVQFAGISESSAKTEAARISFRMNSGKRVQNFALELPSVESFVWPSTS